jgi:hypothetical protein
MKKIIYRVMPTLALLLIFTPVALAVGEPEIVTGTKNLLDAALGWVLLLIPVGCAMIIAWHAFCKQLNEGDPAQAALHNRAMKNALVAGAIGMTAAGTVKIVLAFYGSA